MLEINDVVLYYNIKHAFTQPAPPPIATHTFYKNAMHELRDRPRMCGVGE